MDVEIAQTAILVVIAGVLLWAMKLVRSELRRASAALEAVLSGQKEIQDGMAEVKRRLEELEKKDRARQINWLNSGDGEPDDDGCGFSHARPPIMGSGPARGE